MSAEHLCLKWNNFENNIASYLDILRSENDFVDVTITCGEKNFKAHKVILSACSPYFKGIFQENPCSHPVIILKNVGSNEMEAIIQYIYTGETYIAKDDLFSFLNTANLLQIIGLINYNVYTPSEQENHQIQNGGIGFREREYVSNSKSRVFSGNSTPKSGILVKKFANKTDDSSVISQTKKSVNSNAVEGFPNNPKKRNNSSDGGDSGAETPVKTIEDGCPILSKQLLLPKKRKLSIVDQNKNEFYENSELSNGSEDLKENGTILRNCLEDKGDNEPETDNEEPTFLNALSIKKENEEAENVLEPEVGLCIKEEQEFESASEESLHNGDILLQRLQAFQDGKGEGHSDQGDDALLKVPKPDVSIFSKKLARREVGGGGGGGSGGGFSEGENLTLTPNVEIFLRNANNSSDNLMNKLAKINLFKAKQLKKLKKPISLKSDVMAGTSKYGSEKDAASGGGLVKNGVGNDSKTFHLTNLPCPHCRQIYNNLSALKYHVRLMHSDLENKLFCHLCPMNFIEREYFKIHLWEAHNARF